jgi:hypothetical protein
MKCTSPIQICLFYRFNGISYSDKSVGILVVTLTIYTGIGIILSSVPKVLNLLGALLSKCPRFTSKLKIFGAHTYLASVDANSLVPIGVIPISNSLP